jgi:bifunctional protein TilS/HprT
MDHGSARVVRGRMGNTASTSFAHPVEREFARIFDEHGIAWLYEPHTFVLERSTDGAVREAFTPDFYLPGLDVYVECTVMRDGLMFRKRRKARKARRHGITVEILGRRDIERLAGRWELHQLAQAANTPSTSQPSEDANLGSTRV